MTATSDNFSWAVRLGYGARGVVYVLLGWLAVNTPAQSSGGAQSAFVMLRKMPLGTVLLALVAAGLAGYALFKLLSAVADLEHRGTGAEAVVKRIGDAAGCLSYGFLAWTAVSFATGAKHGGNAGQSQQTAHSALQWTLGPVVVGLVGVGFLVGALMQAKGAFTAGFMKRVSSSAPSGVSYIGRAGYAARTVVFAIVGWSLVQAAWFDNSSQAKGLGQALVGLRSSGWIYTVVAIGLMLFGVFSLVVTRYRIIPDIDPARLKPEFG